MGFSITISPGSLNHQKNHYLPKQVVFQIIGSVLILVLIVFRIMGFSITMGISITNCSLNHQTN